MKDPLLADKKVLVVEDNDASRLLLERILSDLGCEFEVARNGQEAVDKVKNGKFNLVFMDIRMPVMSGYAAARAIREIDKKLPIIALTAHAMYGVDKKCLESGMNYYVSKPFEIEKVKDLILEWAGR
jgi:CheY-like chemotaxis protein